MTLQLDRREDAENKEVALDTAVGTGAHMSLANTLQFDGLRYLASALNPGRALSDEDLGPVLGIVQFQLSGHVTDSMYIMKNGDAAILAAGTPVYTLIGYKPEFRLAARWHNRIVLFEAVSNPTATRAGDLLDIEGKVQYITVHSELDGTTELAIIDDTQRAAALVALLLGVPIVHARRDHRPPRVFLAFHLIDGTTTTQTYWPATGAMSLDAVIPDEFRTIVEQAMRGQP